MHYFIPSTWHKVWHVSERINHSFEVLQKCVALPKNKELMFRNLTLNKAIMVSGAWCGGEEGRSTGIFWAGPGDPESQCNKTPEGRDGAFTQA